jgi:hypothetical protein
MSSCGSANVEKDRITRADLDTLEVNRLSTSLVSLILPTPTLQCQVWTREARAQADQPNANPAFILPSVQPTFPSYLKNVRAYGDGDFLAPASLKKVINTSERFFIWAKMAYPSEFRLVTKAWIDTLVVPRREIPPTPDHEFVTLEEVILVTPAGIGESLFATRDYNPKRIWQNCDLIGIFVLTGRQKFVTLR